VFFVRLLWVFTLIIIIGSCSNFSVTGARPVDLSETIPVFTIGSIQVEINSTHNWEFPATWPDSANEIQVQALLDSLLSDSFDQTFTKTKYWNQFPEEFKEYRLSRVFKTQRSVRAVYSLDLSAIENWALLNYSMGLIYFETSPLAQDSTAVFTLVLPCEDIPVPDRPLYLPNSARNYRSGTHRGIDFQANYGTPFRGVADGIVIRADHDFKDVEADQWLAWTASASDLGRTPDDLFFNVFMGRALIIDHGVNLFPGFRTLSIYAHLSEIDPTIIPGTKIVQGQYLGRTGNSGTLPATRGSFDQAHLHLEIILQGKEKDIYLGQGAEEENLFPYLENIFSP